MNGIDTLTDAANTLNQRDIMKGSAAVRWAKPKGRVNKRSVGVSIILVSSYEQDNAWGRLAYRACAMRGQMTGSASNYDVQLHI